MRAETRTPGRDLSAEAARRRKAPVPERILMTADAAGGVWDYALQLTAALATEGIAVTLATMGPRPNADQRRAAAAVEGLDVISREFRLEWMDDPWDDVVRAGDWLLDLEQSVRPDVVHLNGYVHGTLPWQAPVLMVGHSCVYSWFAAVHGTDPPPLWQQYFTNVRAGLLAADAIASPTRTMLQSLSRHYGPLDGTVIPNGRDSRSFSSGPKGPFVMCAGRLWDEAKNVHALASIAPGLRWPVYLAGDVDHPDGRRFDAGSVNLLGRLSSTALRHWLACASVYVHPARYEPFGLTVLEAALSRCALVLNDIPSLRETWDEAAVFVACDEQAAFRDAINELTGHPGRLNELAERAFIRAQDFSVQRMTRGYLATYEALAGEPDMMRQERASCGW